MATWFYWYYGSVIAWTAFALIREGGSRDYAAFCQIYGMCFFWPITLSLEGIIALANRRDRKRQAAAADD